MDEATILLDQEINIYPQEFVHHLEVRRGIKQKKNYKRKQLYWVTMR